MLRCEKSGRIAVWFNFHPAKALSTSTARYSFDGWFGTDTTVPAARVRGGQFPPIQPHRRRGDLLATHVINPSRSLIAFQIYRMLHNIPSISPRATASFT